MTETTLEAAIRRLTEDAKAPLGVNVVNVYVHDLRVLLEVDRASRPAAVPGRTFPILNGGGATIDYQLVADHAEQAQKNHYQSVDRLAERGGLSWCELHAVLHNKKWEKIDTNEAMLACRALETRYLSALAAAPAAPQAKAGTEELVEALEMAIEVLDCYADPTGYFDNNGEELHANTHSPHPGILAEAGHEPPLALRIPCRGRGRAAWLSLRTAHLSHPQLDRSIRQEASQMIIQMKPHEARIYRAWIEYFGSFCEVTFVERTSAFFAAREGRWPR